MPNKSHDYSFPSTMTGRLPNPSPNFPTGNADNERKLDIRSRASVSRLLARPSADVRVRLVKSPNGSAWEELIQ